VKIEAQRCVAATKPRFTTEARRKTRMRYSVFDSGPRIASSIRKCHDHHKYQIPTTKYRLPNTDYRLPNTSFLFFSVPPCLRGVLLIFAAPLRFIFPEDKTPPAPDDTLAAATTASAGRRGRGRDASSASSVCILRGIGWYRRRCRRSGLPVLPW